MRKLVLLPLLSLIATPAFARDQDAPPPKVDAHAAAKAIGDPRVQASIVGLVDALTDAVLATRVDPAAPLAPNADIRPGDTLGSMESRRNPEFRGELRRDTSRAVTTVGRTAGAAAAMSDELDKTADRIQKILNAVNAKR